MGMETARDSGNVELSENLIRFFVDSDMNECFGACLFTCYDLVNADVALELAWRKGQLNFAMPYLIQVLREYTGRIDALDKKTVKKEQEEEKNKSASNDYQPDAFMSIGMPGMPGHVPHLALGMGPTMPQPGFPQPGMMGGMGGPGMPGMPTPMMSGMGAF